VVKVIAGIVDTSMELHALSDWESSACGYDVTSRSRLQLRGSKLATSLVGILHLSDRGLEAECSLGSETPILISTTQEISQSSTPVI